MMLPKSSNIKIYYKLWYLILEEFQRNNSYQFYYYRVKLSKKVKKLNKAWDPHNVSVYY